MLPVSALNTIVHNCIEQKTIVDKFSFSELKVEKVKFFTQRPTKIFCISFFNVGGCLESCIILITTLAAWLLMKKTCIFILQFLT